MSRIEGRCACGALAYGLAEAPLFVHACHCTRCQRETGGPFAHHLMIEAANLHLLQGQPLFTRVPTDSGGRHWVARCPQCHMAVWNAHGSRAPVIVYLRVGTLDAPELWPPMAHIYARSRQPWVVLDPAVPQFSAYYDARQTWPAASLDRYERAKARRAG